MPQYFAPGVYVEEVSSGAQPIAGVGTSTAGFVGLVSNAVSMPEQPGKILMDTKGNITPVRYNLAAANEPQLITSWENFKNRFGDIQSGNLILAHAVYGFFNNGGTRCWVVRADGGEASPSNTQSGQTERTRSTSTRKSGETSGSNPEASNPGAGGGTQTEVATATTLVLSKEDQLQANRQALPAALQATAKAATKTLTDALDTLKAIDEVAIVAIPGATTQAVQNAIIDHCANEFLQDRFAILDGQVADDKGQPFANLTTENIQGETKNSSYAALYYPWIEVYDPWSDSTITVPPSGHMAGVYARVDATRGVHKAPANEAIRGALNVSNLLTKADQAGLNPDGINIIRKFDNNITVWGARTLADPGKEAEWNYISVRRLFLFLRESIDEGTQWAVFEPNDMALWAKIRRNITAFLTNVWRSGALFGATPQEAFYVRCDETLNPPEVRDLGMVVTEVGVAVVKPAEFVVFRISQWAGPGGQ